MDRQWIWGVVGAVAGSVLMGIIGWIVATSAAGLDAQDRAQIEAVIEANRVLTESEKDQMQSQLTRIDSTLEASLDVQRQLLDAILDD